MSRSGDEHGRWWISAGAPAGAGAGAQSVADRAAASIAGRALVAVVAIMTFLASITTGTVLLVSASAAEWQSEVASEITIQVRPWPDAISTATWRRWLKRCGRSPALSRSAFHQRGVRQTAGTMARQRALARGPAGAARYRRAGQPGTALDLAALRGRVTQAAPTASVDDHRAWIERMRSMTGATVFAGIGILALVIIATIISVSFATRGAMAANRRSSKFCTSLARGPLHRQPVPAAFSAAWAAGGVIGGGMAMLAFGFSESIAGWFSGTPSGINSQRCWDIFAAPVRLSGAGGAGRADRCHHRLGIAANVVRHAGRY